MIRSVLHFFKVSLIFFLKIVLLIVPKKKNLIIFTAWFGKKYADNSMYVFEYMLERYPTFHCYWYTTDKELYDSLMNKNIPTLYSKSIKAKWMQLRAKILVGSIDLSEYNPYLLSGCAYVNLGHGHTIKNPGDIVNNKKASNFFVLLRRGIEYYSIVCAEKRPFSSLDFSPILGKKKILPLGFARNDVFFDSELRIGINTRIDQLKQRKRLISYLPTHRSDGKRPLEISKIFNLEALNDLCEKYNAVFIVKKHFYHRHEIEELGCYRNIIDLTTDMSIETQTLLYQTDVLISDYSACFIDYLLLDRPIILYQFDVEDFQTKERQLLIPFDRIMISSYPKNADELTSELERILRSDLNDGFKEGRDALKKEYFTKTDQSHCRQSVAEFLIKKSKCRVNKQWKIRE